MSTGSNFGDTQDYADNAKVVQLDMEGLYLVSFTRSPSALRLGLTEGPYLKLCRERLVAQGHEYELATGAKIFCEPDQYAATRVAVKHLERTFRPYHVVATEKHLPSVLFTVRSFPHSLKVKVKSSRLIAYIGRSGEASSRGDLNQTPDRARKNSSRHVGDKPPVEDLPSSGSMPLFLQLAKPDGADDQQETGVGPLPTAMGLPQAYANALQAMQPSGMRSLQVAPLQ
jgi:hypothetical protein